MQQQITINLNKIMLDVYKNNYDVNSVQYAVYK